MQTAARRLERIAVIVVGGDALALSTAREVGELHGHRVTVLWTADPEFERQVEAIGARFVAGRPESRESLEEAGVSEAAAILSLSRDDQLNLQTALRARDANPEIRIVLRQFNRTLAAKIEQNLPNCSVLSLAWHSAATYAAVALDPSCLRGLQFPESDGPLTGFARRAAEDGLAGRTVAQAERELGARILAIDNETEFGRDDRLAAGADLVVYGTLHRLLESGPWRARKERGGWRSRLPAFLWPERDRKTWHPDPILGTFLLTILAVFSAAVWHFHDALGSDWVTAAYFVLSTMTTTGYGDITPDRAQPGDIVAAMVLMLAGTMFTGIFTALVAVRLTRAQWVRMQGLRRLYRRGHIVVCGAGSIGSGVIELLLEFGKPLVVIEPNPDTAIVERARDRGFELLTGDASRDETLDLCNLQAAHSLVALSNVDTLNLEIALGARARNPDMPVVLRIAEATFAASIANHFDLKTTFSVAALAGPTFASLSELPDAHGRIAFAGREFGIREMEVRDGRVSFSPEATPLARARNGDFRLIADWDAARIGDAILLLMPLSTDAESAEKRAVSVSEPALVP